MAGIGQYKVRPEVDIRPGTPKQPRAAFKYVGANKTMTADEAARIKKEAIESKKCAGGHTCTTARCS